MSTLNLYDEITELRVANASLIASNTTLRRQRNEAIARAKGIDQQLSCARAESSTTAQHPDTVRLDWLETHRNAGVGAGRFARLVGLSPTIEDPRCREWIGETVRSAIDAAIKDPRP